MHITSKVYPGSVVLALEGRFDFHSLEAFMAALTQVETVHRPGRIIISLHQLTFIDSMAIGRLVGTRYRLQRDSIHFILAGQQGDVDTALKEIKLEALIPTVNSLEEGLALSAEHLNRSI